MTKKEFGSKEFLNSFLSILNESLTILFLLCLVISNSTAQSFDSTSTGADGALDYTGVELGTTIVFDPSGFDPPIDQDNDNIFHFTTINVPEGVTVSLTAPLLNFAPVYWLASGEVLINGTINLSGENGHPDNANDRRPSMPGPGGFPGGVGQSFDSPATKGFGPGGGDLGRAGGYATGNGGLKQYGNLFLLPLIGGSGGSGRATDLGVGGGAGGGALLIASSDLIAINGRINANGGNQGTFSDSIRQGYGGSGGAIRLLAPTIQGNGVLSAVGGNGGFGRGDVGRIRLEAIENEFTGTINGEFRTGTLFPNAIFLPALPIASVRVVSVDGVNVPASPTGSFLVPDVTINNEELSTFAIEARNIPIGTQITLYIFAETGPDQIVQTTLLQGSVESSTATAEVSLPPTFSRVFVHATW